MNREPLIIEKLAPKYPPIREPKIKTGIYFQIIFPLKPKERAPKPFQKIPTRTNV